MDAPVRTILFGGDEVSRLKVPVEEFTTPDPITATESATLEQLLITMKEQGIRHLPIVRSGSGPTQVVGIISDRDCKVASAFTVKEKNLITAKDIMVPDPVTVYCSTSLEDVAYQMSSRKIGSVIVLDEQDRLMGIFTATDALNALIEISRELV